jgi:hypothetical protein
VNGIDHLVLCVRDLDGARARYTALGFTMAPKAQHPFGTGNSNIQLQGSFLEVLTVMAPGDIVEHDDNAFSFSAFNRDFLARGEGLSMLVLESHDPDADQARFSKHNLQTYAPFDFSRQARQPDGSEATVGFSLRFTTDPGMPDAAFFTCRQQAPELFWKAEYQAHANTAQAVDDVAIVSDHPLSHSAFLTGFTGVTDVIAADSELRLETPRGSICVLTPELFEARYHSATPDLSNGARLAGFTVAVKSLAICRDCLKQAGVAYQEADGRLTIPARQNFNAALAFVEHSGP